MITLDADFNDGDFLTAGTITSTSGVNGITTAVNSNTLTKLLYVGSDLTSAQIASSTAETTLGSVTVPAGMVLSGVFVVTTFKARAQAAAVNNCTYTLKTGVASSEVERESHLINLVAEGETGNAISWWDDIADYTGDVSILITGTNSDNHANSYITCHSVIVYGY